MPGSGPKGIKNDPVRYGDNPNTAGVLQASGPRDPDKFDADNDSQREFRQRFIPSGLAREILLDVYERLTSFEPHTTDFNQRLFDAYAAEVARVDANKDGVVSAEEGMWIRPRMAFLIIRVYSSRQRSSTASQSREKSTMGCLRLASPPARRHGYYPGPWHRFAPRCPPPLGAIATTGDRSKSCRPGRERGIPVKSRPLRRLFLSVVVNGKRGCTLDG